MMFARRDSGLNGDVGYKGDLWSEASSRRLSEAGVNRRPSAAQILTSDTKSFRVGERIFVDGVKPGTIQFIGETKFGPGDWAGVALEEPLGRNDGSVAGVKYFKCRPYYGVFSRLFRLTRGPIDGAEKVLGQMKKYGYEIMDAPINNGGSRRGSASSPVGSRRGSSSNEVGSRRGSNSFENRRDSNDFGSSSPRARTPEVKSFRARSPEVKRPIGLSSLAAPR